jgi:hypothetical protein
LKNAKRYAIRIIAHSQKIFSACKLASSAVEI